MTRISVIAIFLLTMLFASPVKADGACGLLFTLQGFRNYIEIHNTGAEFHATNLRPRMVGYYFKDSPSDNPDRLAIFVFVENGCVTLEISALSEFEGS